MIVDHASNIGKAYGDTHDWSAWTPTSSGYKYEIEGWGKVLAQVRPMEREAHATYLILMNDEDEAVEYEISKVKWHYGVTLTVEGAVDMDIHVWPPNAFHNVGWLS